MATKPDSSYGASDFYVGKKGEDYFDYQSNGGLLGGRINAHKFENLISPEFTVLDFGCGGGFMLGSINCMIKIGVDVNPAARECATEMGLEFHTDLKEVPDGVADVVIGR